MSNEVHHLSRMKSSKVELVSGSGGGVGVGVGGVGGGGVRRCNMMGRNTSTTGGKNMADMMPMDIRKQKPQQHQQHQPHHHQQQHAEDVEDFLFGSISPRGGGGVHLSTDLESPEHMHTQRGDTNESDNNISSCSTLDIVNKVEHLSLHQLETQVRELSARLQSAEEQRATVQHQLDECAAEKELCLRRLDVVSTAHECRITEMHCVIAELSKKLRAKQECTILEEQEPTEECSEISYQEEGSIYNSELNLTNPDAECQTDPLDDVVYSAAGGGHGGDNFCNDGRHEDDDDLLRLHDSGVNKGQVEALQEEVLHLRAQIALLQSEIANSLRTQDASAIVEERPSVVYYGEDVEAHESNCSLEVQLQFGKPRNKHELNNLDDTTQSDYITSFKQYEALTSPQKTAPPIPKMAERVKLHCASKTTHHNDNITATDLRNSELKNADIVEHLVSDLKQNNATMMDSFIEPSQLDNELQRLQRKVEHLKVRNTVLALTLNESKEHCEHLYLLCGKYESNAIALQSAVNCSDRAIEAYDVMLALLESKLALIKDKSSAAEESRKAVESVARHLLDRLESEKNVCENSLGPWQNTFSIPDKVCDPWTPEDDNRLRYHVSKLKGRRSTVQNTIVNLESPFSDFYEKSRLALFEGGGDKELRQQENTAAWDLEMAVLMQELLNLREENSASKTKAADAEREHQYAIDRIGILQEALKQLQLQLQFNTAAAATAAASSSAATDDDSIAASSSLFSENRVSYSETEHAAALTEQQLVEALTRESELKNRIQTLIGSVTASQRLADEKYEQLHNNVRELQKSNLCLNQLLEQNKRKYQERIRKLEQKIMDMSQELGRQMGVQQTQLSQHLKVGKSAAMAHHHDNVPETTL